MASPSTLSFRVKRTYFFDRNIKVAYLGKVQVQMYLVLVSLLMITLTECRCCFTKELFFFFFLNTFVISLSCTVESEDLLAYFEEGILQLWKNT